MSKSKILIVEDEKIIAFHIEKLLTSYGYEITDKVISAEDAIRSATENPPDLVMMDITLNGDKDGIYAADEIRKKQDIPIIFLTANTDEKTFQRAKITEPYGYINKPFQGRELKTNIEIALYTSAMRKKVYESEQWLYTTLNSITDAVIATDVDSNIKYINKEAEKLIGYNKNDVLGKKIKNIVKIEEDTSDESLICNFAGFLNSSDISSFLQNKILINSEGKKIPVEETVTKIKDSRDNEIGTAYALVDVSGKRKAQVDLIRNRNFYLSLFEKFPLMIWQSNKIGEFYYFNQSWLNFRGADIEDEISQKWIEGIHIEDREKFVKLYENCFENRKDLEVEFRLKNANGDYRWILCYAKSFEDNNDEFMGYIGSCYDITARKQMEDALRTSKIAADNSNIAKSKFIAMMSHELRTPMNGIIGMAEIVKDLSESLEQKNYINMLTDSAKSLLEILNSILELSRIESGKILKSETDFNLKELLQEISAPYKVVCTKKGVDLKLQINDEVIEEVFADQIKLKQILVNLISNAVKFTNSGSIDIRLEQNGLISEIEEDKFQKVSFIIEDTGIGIDADKQEIIFESFRQEDESFTRQFGGIGLGLPISKQLASILGGNIWVESKKGIGSKFYFSFKCKLKEKSNKLI